MVTLPLHLDEGLNCFDVWTFTSWFCRSLAQRYRANPNKCNSI